VLRTAAAIVLFAGAAHAADPILTDPPVRPAPAARRKPSAPAGSAKVARMMAMAPKLASDISSLWYAMDRLYPRLFEMPGLTDSQRHGITPPSGPKPVWIDTIAQLHLLRRLNLTERQRAYLERRAPGELTHAEALARRLEVPFQQYNDLRLSLTGPERAELFRLMSKRPELMIVY
jgi:hypothetical protein